MEKEQKAKKDFVPNFYKRKIEAAESQAESLRKLVEINENINRSLIRIGTKLETLWVTVRK